jgi:DNA-directed RNA polymerase
MVHDSYSTVPADADALATATREAFVSLYTQHDVIGGLDAQLRAQADNDPDFPSPPPAGSLDVSVVLRSPYFFA